MRVFYKPISRCKNKTRQNVAVSTLLRSPLRVEPTPSSALSGTFSRKREKGKLGWNSESRSSKVTFYSYPSCDFPEYRTTFLGQSRLLEKVAEGRMKVYHSSDGYSQH
jgi:hypothetical protein